MGTRFGYDRSNRGAALLLLEVRMIAIGETRGVSPSPPSSPCLTFASSDSNELLLPPEERFSHPLLVSDEVESNPVSPHSTPKNLRCRTVSVCSQDIEDLKQAEPSSPTQVQDIFMLERHEEGEANSVVSFANTRDSAPCSDPTMGSESSQVSSQTTPRLCDTSSKFVGDKVEGPVKAVLRKKFSWKSYPELEAYLVENREKYMQFSSQLNYTAEQKRYNNTLTQGLLDLACREGYCFEGFTFAAIRDRIRCYYKSYVQASKKRKRRRSA